MTDKSGDDEKRTRFEGLVGYFDPAGRPAVYVENARIKLALGNLFLQREI